jgi:CheY-like chemotaxis protein
MTRRPGTVSGLTLPTILLVEADEDAQGMVRDALLEGARPSVLRTVAGPAELTEYLRRADAHSDPVTTPLPGLVLVDLDNGGLEAIRTVKQAHARIPVIALTRRPTPEATAAAYDAGANTVLPRPVTFLAFVRLMKVFTAYWLEAAELPREDVA